ncbi:MAG: LuxR C-terminal-related transcriptional regulator [Betaproteobacteria bacterium]
MARAQRASARPAIELLHALIEATPDRTRFARTGVEMLPTLVASDLTTLSVCHLDTGQREVIGHPGPALAAEDIAAFDRHFFEHPLVRFHTGHPGGGAHRLSDAMPARQFKRTALYNDYYRRIGIRNAVAVPLHVDPCLLVSFVLNRTGRDFTDDEMRNLEAVRHGLASLYRHMLLLERHARSQLRVANDERMSPDSLPIGRAPAPATQSLTRREREVLSWVSSGKSDAQIAAILGRSVRTVHKHLEHAYVKLGVENRTAAVMRLRQHGHPFAG